MFQKKNTLILLGFCAAFAACDGAPSRSLMAPEDPSAETMDAQSLSVFAQSNTWAATRGMLIPRILHRAGTLNNVIYVVGGQNENGILRRLDAYDVVANTWSIRKPLPSGRSDVNGITGISGRLYVAGGLDDAGRQTKTLYVYNPKTNLWVQRANMPQVGNGGTQGVISGLLYVYPGSSTGVEQLFRYSPATNTWTTLAAPPNSHFNAAGGALGGKFYLAGGGTDRDKLDIYDPATNTWATGASMAAPANDVASAFLGGKLYVAGGADLEGSLVATLRVYSPTTNTWTIKAPMPTPRWITAGAAAGGRFFVLGGRDNATVTRKVLAYTP